MISHILTPNKKNNDNYNFNNNNNSIPNEMQHDLKVL